MSHSGDIQPALLDKTQSIGELSATTGLELNILPPTKADPPTYASASPRSFALLLFFLCIAMHAALVGGFLALVILRWKLHDDAISFSGNQKLRYVTGTIFYYATMYPKTIVQVSPYSTVTLVL